MAKKSDKVDRYGHHTTWCTEQSERHEAPYPYCQYQVNGVEGVTDDGWLPAQVWVDAIQAFLHGQYTGERIAAEEQYNTGVQLTALIREGDRWDGELRINLPSGQARSLAAMLIAAADISEHITNARHR